MGGSTSKLSPEESAQLQKETHFDKKTLNHWHGGFVKDCPSGSITLPEFTRIYRQYFPFGDPGPLAEHVFRAFDLDGNGAIHFKDFVSALSVASKGDLDDRLQFAFRLYDVNGDGYISRNEMTVVVEAIYRLIGTMVELPEDERTPELRVDKIFSAFDINKDGRLSPEEFREGAKRDPRIVQALGTYQGVA